MIDSVCSSRNRSVGNSMSEKPLSLPDNPKKAFERYILELERSYRPWYKWASSLSKTTFVIGQATAILAGAATASVAALATKLDNVKWLLVLLPLVGAFSTALLAQTRVRDILALRENGRQQITALIDKAKAAYAAASDEAAFSKLHTDLISAVNHLERQQAIDLLAIIPVRGTTPGDPAAGASQKPADVAGQTPADVAGGRGETHGP
jgi:hypothetical protein